MPEIHRELRERAIELNNQLHNIDACIPGKGNCCIAGTPLTQGDIDVIQEAIARGEISKETIDHAIEKANQGASGCPFLTEGKRCSIYEQRPLICAVWGIGGKPSAEGFTHYRGKDGKVEGAYQAFFLAHDACSECSTRFNKEGVIPVSVLNEIDASVNYSCDEKVTSTREFVKEQLQDTE